MEMDIGNINGGPYVAAGRTDINAQYKKPDLDERQASDPEGTEPPTLVEEIREKGFVQYTEELKEKKKEELRAKILGEMKLTEEDLAKMSPELRAQIEKMIEAEIRNRMTAEGYLDKQNEDPLSLHDSKILIANDAAMSKIDGAGVGMGPLLALQEIEALENSDEPQKEEDIG
ncbi:MAG: hypothetical protein OQK24_11520 [Magnetovibrio sp.]|nr:hypothetical protein [Magnetovibrio sp.]